MLLNDSHIRYDSVATGRIERAFLPHLHIKRESPAGKNGALSKVINEKKGHSLLVRLIRCDINLSAWSALSRV